MLIHIHYSLLYISHNLHFSASKSLMTDFCLSLEQFVWLAAILNSLKTNLFFFCYKPIPNNAEFMLMKKNFEWGIYLAFSKKKKKKKKNSTYSLNNPCVCVCVCLSIYLSIYIYILKSMDSGIYLALSCTRVNVWNQSQTFLAILPPHPWIWLIIFIMKICVFLFYFLDILSIFLSNMLSTYLFLAFYFYT